MTYLLKRNNHYYYNRRVPDIFRDLDTRDTVRVALNTDSKRQAWRNAILFNEQVEAYWQSLVRDNRLHDGGVFHKTVRIARQMGFVYQPLPVIAALPVLELVERTLALRGATPKQVEAVLGGKEEAGLDIKKALEEFWKLSKDQVLNKTPDQVRKWRNPRIKAVENFILIVGNKKLKDIIRDDIVAFRDWWIERVQNDEKNPSSANKDFIHLKGVLELVSGHFKAGLDIDHLFKKIKLKNRFKKTRLPFTSQQIITLLHSDKLKKLNEEARWFLFVAAETGARPSEIAGLLPEDIRLNCTVPHIAITDRKERTLKTAHSERVIPLVGYALDAFKAMPKGFPRYRDKPDNLTNAANKFLRDNDLLPSAQHSVYSFRHSFQDRILNVKALDRVQAELMGHRFKRPDYGTGVTLEHKKEWLDKICLKPN